MKHRKLRTAWWVEWGVACVLLIALSGAVVAEDNVAQPNSLPSSAPVAPSGVPHEKAQAPAPQQQAGIGVALRVESGKVVVNKVLPDTPADRSGAINVNDQIVAIAEGRDEPTVLSDIKDVAKVVGMIRGPIGSIIRLSIIPAGKSEADQIVVRLVRGNIKQINMFVDGRLLPVGSKAPNFKFTPLANCENSELGQLQGRIIVVEFWATWCGPCVKSLSEIDSLRTSHPEWAKRVSILAISVDDSKEEAAKLLAKKQFQNVAIAWAGIEVLAEYRVASLPTIYVIDQAGRVVAVDHRLDVPALIKPLLEQSNESHTPRSE